MISYHIISYHQGFPGGSDGKKSLPAMQDTWVQSLGWEDPLEKEMATHSVLVPREFHGQRSLVGHGATVHGVIKS